MGFTFTHLQVSERDKINNKFKSYHAVVLVPSVQHGKQFRDLLSVAIIRCYFTTQNLQNLQPQSFALYNITVV